MCVRALASIQLTRSDLNCNSSTPQDAELIFQLKYQEGELKALQFKVIPLSQTTEWTFSLTNILLQQKQNILRNVSGNSSKMSCKIKIQMYS